MYFLALQVIIWAHPYTPREFTSHIQLDLLAGDLPATRLCNSSHCGIARGPILPQRYNRPQELPRSS